MKKYRSNTNKKYLRDMVGYGSKNFKVRWPNNARIALQIVLNYEEGAENCVLHGDKTSEIFLSEIIGAQPIKGCLLYTSPSPRDGLLSRMPSSA